MYRYRIKQCDKRGRYTISREIYLEKPIENARIGDIIIMEVYGEIINFILIELP